MAESQSIKEVVNQAAIHAAMAVMIVLRYTDAGPQPPTVVSHRKPQRQRHNGPIHKKPTCNWDAQDRYVELVNFEKEVLSMLDTKLYALLEEVEVPVIKSLLGWEGLQPIQMFMQEENEKSQTVKDYFTVLHSKF